MLLRKALVYKRLSIVLENESLLAENIHNLEALKKVFTENKDNLPISRMQIWEWMKIYKS